MASLKLHDFRMLTTCANVLFILMNNESYNLALLLYVPFIGILHLENNTKFLYVLTLVFSVLSDTQLGFQMTLRFSFFYSQSCQLGEVLFWKKDAADACENKREYCTKI